MKKIIRYCTRLMAPMTASLVIGGVFLAAATPLRAQPDLNVAPKGENPPNQGRGRGDRLNRFRFEGQNMTREQQMEFARTRRREMVREMLTRAGFADAEVQDAVAAHLEAREAAQPKVREAAIKMLQAMNINRGERPGGAGGVAKELVPETKMLEVLTAYRTAVEADRAARQEAEKELDKKIKFSGNPRLEMTLILLGALGDGSPVMGGPMVGGMMVGGPMMGGPMLRFPVPGAPMPDNPFGRGGFDGDERGRRGDRLRERFDGPRADGRRDDEPFFERRPRRDRFEDEPRVFGGDNGF